MLTKYAKSEQILEIKVAHERLDFGPEVLPGDGFNKFASLKDEGTSQGYLYVRTRAISSRVNKNNDGWPSEELAKAYKTFVGRPVFVDHNNDDPKRARGVIIDARLHVEDDEKTSALDPYYANAPNNHKPPTWIELLLEVDGRTFPKLATAIRKGYIDATSMGANIEYSICNICENRAENPQEYCAHVKTKGAEFEVTSHDGSKSHKKAYEDCFGINFFEDSFVFDPADPTALITEKKGHIKEGTGFLDDPGMEDFDPGEAPVEWADQPENEYPVTRESEPERVKAWRLEQLLRAGYPENLAVPLAENFHIDLHQLVDILGQGAKPEQAYQIYTKHFGTYTWKRTNWDDKCPDCGSNMEKVLKEAFDDDNLYKCHSCSKNHRVKPKTSAIEDIRNQACPKCGGMLFPKISGQHYQTCMDCGSQIPLENIMIQQPKEAPRIGARELDQIRIVALDQVANPADQEHERQLNYEPQSQMTTAPAEVDTLRKDYKCPNCKSDYMVADPDGLLRCQTCSYVTPPHPLDNPDLSVHQDIDVAEQNKERSELPGDINELMDQIKIQPKNKQGPTDISPISPINPINQMASSKGINRMKWTTVSNLASIDTFLGNEDGITFNTYKALQESRLSARVIYPTGEESNIPFDNPVRDMVLAQKAKRYAKLNTLAEIPITVEADLKDIDEVLEIIHTAAPVKKKIINPAIKTITEDPQNAKIISDAQAPVTSSEKEADRRRIRRSEEDSNGIKRTEEIVEETSDSVSPYSDMSQEESENEPEETEENTENQENYAMASEKKILAAFSLAEELVSAGYLDASHKLSFVAKFEKATEDEIRAWKEAAELMKKNKKVAPKTAGRLPRFSSFMTEASDTPDVDDISFEAIFL